MSLKILIIRLSSIGDVVHTLPALGALRKACPDAHIGWLVEELSSPLLKGHSQLDRLFVFRRKWRSRFSRHFFPHIIPFFKKLRAERYDFAIDFQGLTKSGMAAYFSGARRIIGFGDKDGREFNKLFTNIKVRPPADLHIVEKNLALLRPLEITGPSVEFTFPDFSSHLDSLHVEEPFIAVNPGAGWITKRLPLDTLARVSSMLHSETGMKLLILWGPGEREMAESLRQKVEALEGSANLAPPTTLPQVCALLSRASLFIGGDTGPTHIAAAMGIPVLSWFGASDALRNRPWGARCLSIQKREISCVPCWKKICRFQDNRSLACLKSISGRELFENALKLLRDG